MKSVKESFVTNKLTQPRRIPVSPALVRGSVWAGSSRASMVMILPPLFEPYWLGLVFVIVSQIVTVPLCILSHSVKQPAIFILCGMISAVCGYILPPILAETVVSNGFGTPLSCLLGRFLGG